MAQSLDENVLVQALLKHPNAKPLQDPEAEVSRRPYCSSTSHERTDCSLLNVLHGHAYLIHLALFTSFPTSD